MKKVIIPSDILDSTWGKEDILAGYVYRVCSPTSEMTHFMYENAKHPYAFKEIITEGYKRAHSEVHLIADEEDMVLFRLHFGF